MVSTRCRQCDTRQDVEEAGVAVRVTDVEEMRDLLDGRPAAVCCRACGAVLPVEFRARVVADRWTAEIVLCGDGRAPELPRDLTAAFDRLLRGVVAALWQAPNRRAQHEIARARYDELTAEAMAGALLAAKGRLPDWVVGDGEDGERTVDDMLGPPQATALVSAALSVLGRPERTLAATVERHVSTGLVMPRAARDLGDAVAAMCSNDQLTAAERLVLLTMHAAARAAAGQDDPLKSMFTRQWVAFAWAADETPEDIDLLRLRPPAELLEHAVDPTTLTAVVHETTDAPAGWMERLQRVAEQAGHPRLIRQAARQAPVMGEASSEVLRSALGEVARLGEARRLAEGLRLVLGTLIASGRIDELGPMTDHALALSDGEAETRAMLLAQLGSAAKDARRPALFLDKVGVRAAAWEADLSDEWQLSLDTERSSALRMAGRATEAGALLRPYRKRPFDRDTRWRLEFNLALSDRDAGGTDLGLRTLERLLAEAVDDDERFLAHQALARTVTALGRQPESVAHLRAAIGLAHGEHAHHVPTLRASLASVLAAAGDGDGARAELAALDTEGLLPQAEVAVADTVAVLLEIGEEVEEALVDQAMAGLARAETRAGTDGDSTVQGSALRVRARLHELLGDTSEAAADWEALLEVHRDELALVSLATLRGARGEIDTARALLVQVPDALLAAHRGASDLGALLDSTRRLRGAMRRLSSVMLAGRPLPKDVRLAAELSRDAIGRARAWAGAEAELPSRVALAGGLCDEALKTLAPAAGTLRVLEWWEASQGVVTLLTEIDLAGGVAMRVLPAMPTDAREAAEQVRARLQGWWPGRRGDPLDHPGWSALAAWLQAELADAGAEDHLVVIEHEGLVGLPWHTLDGTWTVSYAPSWSALLDRPAVGGLRAHGVLSVPARREAPATLEAFDAAVGVARSEARARGDLALDVLEGTDADVRAALALFGRSDVMTLLCHGLVDPEQLDLALLVAADDQLPSQHPVAASSASGREHRLTWRALQQVRAGPAVVLSAGCSTGHGLIGGMGERLGIFGALRPRGTRAVIAPAWDAVAIDVAAQLEQVRSLVLNGVPAGAAVRTVGDEAAERLPAWRARCLCVEGDWR